MARTGDDPPAARELFERFLALRAEDLEHALSDASDLVAEALDADKVDAFMFDAARASLVAVGTSRQPLSDLQRKSGLDVLSLANGGSCVQVFRDATPFFSGRLRDDASEVLGVREVLKVESHLVVRLEVAGTPRGVLAVASQTRDKWTERDLRFAEGIARWVTIVMHRAELTAQVERAAVERGRRAAAEELLTTAAHDLRNFFAPLMLRLSAVRRRAERDGRTLDLQDVDPSISTLLRMEGVITDLLDVARIDRGLFELELTRVELKALLEDVASSLAATHSAVEVDAREQVWAEVDPMRVRQCLENVLANALKHGAAGGSVRLSLRRESREQRAFARIEIADQGPGIPEHLLPHVFDRFVTSTRGRGAGLGLGLFLAKGVATLHGGDLTVSSTMGRGTRFVLTLPCASTSSRPPS